MSVPWIRRPTLLLLLAILVSLYSWKLLELSWCLDVSQFLYNDAPRNDNASHSSSTFLHHTHYTDELVKRDELHHWGQQTYHPNRVLCAVPTTWNHSLHKIQRLQQTWGPFCDKLLLVVAGEHELPPTDTVTVDKLLIVNMTRSADPKERNIWTKVHNMWSAIADHYINEAEWFLKVDDDTYLFPDHLRKFTQYYNPNIPRYFGHTILYR